MRYISLTALSCATLLGACGGSTTTVDETGPNGLPFGTAGLIANKSRLESLSGDKFTAGGVLGTYNTDVFAPTAEDVTADITLISDTRLRIKLDGTTYTLTSSNGGASFASGDVTVIPVYSSSSSAGTQSVLFYRVLDDEDADDTVFSAHLISGFETRSSEMPSGTATYTGSAGMEVFNSAGDQVTLFDDPGNLLRPGDLGDDGTLSLEVNFGTRAVGGTITAAATFEGAEDPLELTLSGTVSGTSISGTLTETGVDNPHIAFTGGTFDGQFFGQGAGDVGGTISADVTISGIGAPTDGTNAAVGFFVGAK